MRQPSTSPDVWGLPRFADRFDFEALRSRQRQSAAILVAYDIMEMNTLPASKGAICIAFELKLAQPEVMMGEIRWRKKANTILDPTSQATRHLGLISQKCFNCPASAPVRQMQGF